MIKVYTTSICAYCQMVKKILNEKELAYLEVNLDDNAEMREYVTNMTGASTVPVVTKLENDTETVISVGWQPHKLLSLCI